MEVTIAPSSSCYFAGEEFRVNITFTNSTAPSAAARSHRRGHSISSAPLARPPTSPGVFSHKYTPSSPVPLNTAPINTPGRRGLVGGNPIPFEHPAKTRLKRLAGTKSLSTSLSQTEVEQIVVEAGSASPSRDRKVSSEKPFPSNHPHARKQSVQWNLIENVPPPTAHLSPHPLSLDVINEVDLASPPVTPGFPSPALAGSSAEPPLPHAAPGAPSSTDSRGAGIEFPRGGNRKSASVGILPIQGAETLLWAYAQVSGNVEIDEDTVDYSNLSIIRTRVARSGPIGGGRMDLHDRNTGSPQQTEGSWSSFFGLSSLSPYRNTSPSPSSFLSSMLSVRANPARMMPQPGPSGAPNSLPTFNPPQSMLAVDLTLAPGESKTYTYTVRLPSALPPTYRGRTFKFSYNLVVGTCRGKVAGADSQSRLLRIPLRVYNHVSVSRPSVRYDLLWPATLTGRSDFGAHVDEVLNTPPRHAVKTGLRPARVGPQGDLLRQFGRDLIRGQVRQDHDDIEDVIDHTTGDGCRLAVEVLTRQAKKGVITGQILQAEQHHDMAINLGRTPFSLDIPSDASPGFGIDVDGKGGGGLEWRVRICFLVGDGNDKLDLVGGDGEWGVSKAAGDGEGLGKLETVECEVPMIVLPAHTVFASIPVSFPV
ncbi:hypothetical protein M408DRAFT_62228 [Serendipita vermifera MAFF 305830]|uniref:Rgp1-domain-containing protein n=1 Tax=Serendipita vermifera MAFF 305830 TaxID=933852 RepID=A0A0C3B711_SERVB|nr:hypothetical protein M408DRAFT_62228 [Serendipita vermifera MAFF 305830]